MARLSINNFGFMCERFIENSTRSFFSSRLYFKSSIAKKETEVNEDTHCTIYEDTSAEYRIGKKYAIMKLQQLFNLGLFSATEIAMRFKKLQLVSSKTMSDNYNLLKKEGVEDAILLQYPDILAQNYVEQKVVFLKTLPFPVKDTVPLVNIEFAKFKFFIYKQFTESKNINGGRIGFFSNLLEITTIQACDVIVKRPFLQKIDLNKVENNYKVLIKFGIKPDEIRKDYWVLRYNANVIENRLQTVKQLDVGKVKTWMVRAQPEIFNNYIKRRSDNKSILGENSIAEYLSEKLECSLENSQIILEKHPALLSKSMKKLEEIIDFLINDGYNSVHIVRNPKILLHSVETTRKRLKELQEQGVKMDSLHILTKSQKQYKNYYQNIVKMNKSKTQDKK